MVVSRNLQGGFKKSTRWFQETYKVVSRDLQILLIFGPNLSEFLPSVLPTELFRNPGRGREVTHH